MNPEIQSILDALKIEPSDPQIYQTALTHRSFLNENRSAKEHNERLEFLGDAVLELIVTEKLFERFPDMPEGDMTALRASVVRRESFTKVAEQLKLDAALMLSRGESSNTGKARQVILSNAFEAFIGAIYLDKGYDTAKRVVLTLVEPMIESTYTDKSYIDAKSQLQEILQARRNITPHYELHTSTGPDHAREFEVGVYVGTELLANGHGHTKQQAEMDAARAALRTLDGAKPE